MIVSVHDQIRDSKDTHFRIENYILHNKDFQSFIKPQLSLAQSSGSPLLKFSQRI